MAFAAKAVILVFGAGLAAMWEVVFADVGAVRLPILNAIRIKKMKF